MLGLLALFETYENLEGAVASFGDAGEAAPLRLLPLHSDSIQASKIWPRTILPQPGRFKDPRSGDYFNVDAEGKIEFTRCRRSRWSTSAALRRALR